MNVKSIVVILSFAAGCLVATMFFTPSGTAQSGDPPNPDAGNSSSSENIFVRYARAYLKLAKAELGVTLDVNRRIGATYPETTVQRLRNHVEIAKAKLQYELTGDESKLHDIHLKELEGARKLAESKLANAITVNQRLSGTISVLEIQRLRSATELARLAITMGRDPTAVGTPHAHLQWQLDQMRGELLQLQTRTDKLAASR